MIRDLDRPVDEIRADVSQLETWRDRFVQAIQTDSVMLVSITWCSSYVTDKHIWQTIIYTTYTMVVQ